METDNNEKDWLRRMKSANLITDDAPVRYAGSIDKSKKTLRVNSGPKGFCDIAGMDSLKTLVTESLINVLNNLECACAYGITPPSILMYGPAGCGKTYFAEAIAKEAGVKFMKVVPDDIASKWVHGTQERINEVFRKAEKMSPVILFFDEIDAMVPSRTQDDSHSQNGEVNEFLCKLNNASEKGIFVIAATNHPEVIDKAVLRTGRIDEMIYVDMPDKSARESLFRLSLSKIPATDDIDYARLADLTSGYNCSDISYIVKVASRNRFNATIADKSGALKPVTQALLEEVISKKSPSVSSRDLREYERVRNIFSPKDRQVRKQAIGFRQ